MPFDGRKVLSLESRRAAEMDKLIRINGGEPFVAPSMREVPLDRNDAAFAFGERLFKGEFDMVMLLTGVGTRYLHKLLAGKYGEECFPEALRQVTTVARGPKPAAALREMGVPVQLFAPSPNTWREVLAVTENRPERHVAVQEYGRTSPELIEGLQARGCTVTVVPVYQWELPEDTGPLREAAHRLACGEFDVSLFTTSIQVQHLLEIAVEENILDHVRDGLQRTLIASIGPTTTEALEEHGFTPAMEPCVPKMGVLVQEAAAQAPAWHHAKQRA